MKVIRRGSLRLNSVSFRTFFRDQKTSIERGAGWVAQAAEARVIPFNSPRNH